MKRDVEPTTEQPVVERRERYGRRIGWGLLAAGLVVFSWAVFDPELPDRRLEAASPAPVVQSSGPAGTVPQPAPEEMGPPAPDAGDTALQGPPSPETTPALQPVSPDDPPYVGPHAPEFTGSPAPPMLGLADGVLFGHPVLGLQPEALRRLREAEDSGTVLAGEALGVEAVVGYRAGSRAHSQGLAVDLNYFANPYLMHESGEAGRDALLAPVYHRIARTMLGRDSVIPQEITEGAPDSTRTLRLFRALRDESRAMVAYFRLMRDRDALTRFLESREPKPGESATAPPPTPSAADELQRQMAQDYVTLAGRPGPMVAGLEYPTPDAQPGDPPFAGDPTYRGPELGFLNLREELVQALTDTGLRWGGTDMGSNSGDLMHFYLSTSELGASR